MAKKIYKMKAQVWEYPDMAAWFFVNVDKKQSGEIKEKYTKTKRGFGSVRVEATLRKTKWKTSIFPDKQSGTYLLPLKSEVRRAEGIDGGDTISFTFAIQ